MKKALVRFVSGSACVAITLFWIGCASGPTSQSTGQYIDSAAITAKVKAALIDDPVVGGFDVDVDTYKDVVQLNGFVDSAAEKQRAEEIAWGIEGVRAVQNNLTVRTEIQPEAQGQAPRREPAPPVGEPR